MGVRVHRTGASGQVPRTNAADVETKLDTLPPERMPAGMECFVKESVIAAPVEAVFAFHETPGAFERLQPPWERMEVIQPPTSLAVGTVVIARTYVGPLPITIEAEHVAFERNVRFEDVMRRGPFSHWHHRHLFFADPGGCRLRDEIDYALPMGRLGQAIGGWAVRARLKKMFDHRHRVTAEALAHHQR